MIYPVKSDKSNPLEKRFWRPSSGPFLEIYRESIFFPAQLGAFSGDHLGAISEAHLRSSLGVHFSVFRAFLGPHWLAFLDRGSFGSLSGGRFLRLYNGNSRGRFGDVNWGPIWGPFWVYFLGPFEVVLYGVLHIDNSIAFPISIWKCSDGLGIPVCKLLQLRENALCRELQFRIFHIILKWPIIFTFQYKIMTDSCRYILSIPLHILIFSRSILVTTPVLRSMKLCSVQYTLNINI